MKPVLIALAIMVLGLSASSAKEKQRQIGSFLVQEEKDPFDNTNNVIAMTVSNGGWIAGFRCLQSKPSIVIASLTENYKAGDAFEIKLRADDKEIFDEPGIAIDQKLIEVEQDAAKIIDNSVGAKTFSVRIIGDTTITFTVNMKDSDKVIGLVKAACAEPAKQM